MANLSVLASSPLTMMEDGEEVGEERGSSSWKCGAAGVERPREASKEKAAGITGKSVAVVVKNSSPPLAPSHGKRVGTGTGPIR